MYTESLGDTLRVHKGKIAACCDKAADTGILISFRFSSLNTMTVFNDKWHDWEIRNKQDP